MLARQGTPVDMSVMPERIVVLLCLLLLLLLLLLLHHVCLLFLVVTFFLVHQSKHKMSRTKNKLSPNIYRRFCLEQGNTMSMQMLPRFVVVDCRWGAAQPHFQEQACPIIVRHHAIINTRIITSNSC